jgi:hypothetical protein
MSSKFRQFNTLVILVAPELIGVDPDVEQLCTTIRSACYDIRVLVRVADPRDLTLAATLGKQGFDVELLLGCDITDGEIDASPIGTPFVRMPPHSSAFELDQLALALSDVVICDPRLTLKKDLWQLAQAQSKQFVAPGDALSAIKLVRPDTAGWLDPDRCVWRAIGLRFCGRLEQLSLEVLGWNWLARRDSLTRIWRCISFGWSGRQSAYFAPEKWKKLLPDAAAVRDSAPIVHRFEALDRAALLGGHLHRDEVWFTHLASVFAVGFAVAESIHSLPFGAGEGWSICELIALALIAGVIFLVLHGQLQERWTACRLAAEQLRIARMCLPLLIVPPEVRGPDRLERGMVDPAFLPLAEVKRTIRDQGLPRLTRDFSVSKALAWLDFIVADQAGYHERNHRKLHKAETRLGYATRLVFLLAVIAVLAHFTMLGKRWSGPLLFFTAAGPALAAALHGAGTRLGIRHRIALSQATEQKLNAIHDILTGRPEADPAEERDWPWLRQLAVRAAAAMGSENTSWHELVRREPDDFV